ncbi:MAG: amidohydrolase family protein [Cyclobacteriaceae bacterium]
MNRRKFIKQSSGIAAGLAVAPLSCSQTGNQSLGDQDYPIIDTHQHLWDKEIFRLKWTKPPIDKGDFLIPEYRKEVKGLNVVKTIYMEVDISDDLREFEANFALGLCDDPSSKMVGAVIYGHPDDNNFRSFISKFSNNPKLKGVRSLGEKERLFSNKALKNLQWLGDQGLFYDLGVGPTMLIDCSDIVKKCPNTTFILNHCGTADPIALFPDDIERPRPPKYDVEVWKKGISMLANQDNVICKISGIVAHAREYKLKAMHVAPTIDFCLDSFGPDKVVFAGDWPTCLYNMPLRQWILTLKEVVKSRSYAEQKKLFHDNAERIYKV